MAPSSHKKASASKPSSSTSSRAWDSLNPALSPWLLDAVSTMGFERMTPVQTSTIPLFMGSKDVVVEAVTGSGKTLAFLVPVVERLLRLEEPVRKHHVAGIIVSPTRELASQIYSVLLSLLAFHAPSAAAMQPQDDTDNYNEKNLPNVTNESTAPATAFPSSTLKVIPQLLLGGTTTPSQDLAHFLTQGPNLLIATPGRLLELLSSPHVHCPQSSFEVLVLDEADRLLDLGFKEDLQKILQRLPKQRRTGLFSASISEAVDQLVRVGLRNPVKIAVKVKGAGGTDDQRTPASLQMTYLTTHPSHKLPTLLSLLHNLSPPPQKSIVYLSTCAAVDYFSHLLPHLLTLLYPDSTLTCIPLHGKHPPAIRTKNFTRFVSTPTPTLLITTDLAARGLDIPAVDLVVQLDPPSDPKTFLHRAGRAGRAGRKGLAVVFLLPGRETDEYPPFLAVRKTPVHPLSAGPLTTIEETPSLTWIAPPSAETTTAHLRTLLLTDRSLHDKSQRAFVSWVRAYSKHAAASIFRIADVDWEAHGHGWGLLKLPRMPELKAAAAKEGATPVDTTLGVTVDWPNYAHKDLSREKKRRAELAARTQNPAAVAAANEAKKRKRESRSEAWSERKGVKEVAVARREKRAKRSERVRVAGLGEEEKKREEEGRMLVEEVKGKVARGEMRAGVGEGEEVFEGFD